MKELLFALALLVLAPHEGRADEVNGIRNSLAPVGDVDGDGVPDFALALRSDAPTSSGKPREDLGRVVIVSGATGARIRILTPRRAPDANFGRVIEDLGDVDGDGHRDLAITETNRVSVFSGANGAVLWEFGDPSLGAEFGRLLSGGGDLDGDGIPDLAVMNEDQVFVFCGKRGSLHKAIGCSPRPDWVPKAKYTQIRGKTIGAAGLLSAHGVGRRAALAVEVSFSRWWRKSVVEHELRVFGGAAVSRIALPGTPWIVRSLPDVNGDGVPEIVLTIIHRSATVYCGRKGSELQHHSWQGGYMHAEGTSLEIVGDIDGDGTSDYLIGANEDSLDCDPGMAEIYSGRDGSTLRAFEVARNAVEGRCGVGVDTCALGDVDGDTIPDVVVHLPRLREARILSGADFSVLRTIDVAPGSALLSADAAPEGD